MKKILVGALVVPFLFTSCEKDSKLTTEAAQVKMSATVLANSKSPVYGPINSTFSTDFPIGIYAHNGAWLAGSAANEINNDEATVAGAAGHAVTFGSGPYYYPANGSTLYFFAFAPQASETTAAGAGSSPEVTHAITGHEDVMWASSTGYKSGSSAAVNPVLNFAHKLTQLQFTFKSGSSYPASGYKVVSLKVKSQPTDAVMTVETGALAFSGSADMEALSAADQLAGIGITTAGTDANSPIMTQTSSGATAYYLDIVVKPVSGSNVTYSNVPVNVTSAIGSAHMITLTFNATSVSCSATVADWVTGATGSGSVQ